MNFPVHYAIELFHPQAHVLKVTLTIENPEPTGQELWLPSWIPGSYLIRDFAKHIVQIHARTSQGDEVRVSKLEKARWRCQPCDGKLIVEYQLYARDLSVRGAHFDTRHAFFNNTSTCLAVKGREQQPHALTVCAPADKRYQGWQVATAMRALEIDERAFGLYQADDYDELIDHPFEVGELNRLSFCAEGVEHEMVFVGRHRLNKERLAADMQKICSYQIRLFGEAPFERYLFMTHVLGDGFGGLEHRASTALHCSRRDLPRQDEATDTVRADYRKFLALCSHEYFHSWNIKRIKPEAFFPYDLTRESYTEQLWAFEGITSYYDELALLRAGVVSQSDYLEMLGQAITRMLRGSGRRKQTVTESSFDAWTRFYQQDENAPNAIVSYYVKGAKVALLLDLTLRQITNQQKSLDDVMQLLWQRYGQQGKGVPEQGIQAIAEEVAGESLAEFFELALYSTDELPLREKLAEFGVGLHLRPRENNSDTGGKPATKDVSKLQNRPELGLRHKPHPLGAEVVTVYEGGAGQRAGLSAGDVIIAVDNLKVDSNSLDEAVALWPIGSKVRLHAFRRDELLELQCQLSQPERNTAYLTIEDEAKARRWLLG